MWSYVTSVGDSANALGSGRIAEKTEDNVNDLVWVVEEEHLLGLVEDGLVGLLLRNLPLRDLHVASMETAEGAAVKTRASRGRGHDGRESNDLGVFHSVGD